MTIWNSTCNPCFSTFDQIYFVFHGLKTGFFFVIHWSLILCVTQIDFLPMTTVCGTGEKTNFNYIFKFTVIHPFDTFMFCCGYVRITGNFCGVKFLWFWSKKKTFNFCRFFFLRIVNLGTEKKIVCITGSNKWSDVTINNWCTLYFIY